MAIGSFLALGLPVTRLLLRLRQPTAANLAAGLSDVETLLSGISDEGHRREIARSLQHITDRVLRRIDRYVQAEFGQLAENELQAAVMAVSDALEQAGSADITLLVKHDLDAKALQDYTIANSQFRKDLRGLPEATEELSKALLTETVYAVVELARRHPDLTVSALVELLQRTGELRTLLESVEASLAEMPRLLVSSANGTRLETARERDFARFDVDYRRAVLNDYDKLELYGVDLTRETRRYSLTTAYLSLRVVREEGMAQGKAEDLDAVMPRGGLLILRGVAGAGKTTILHWLAVNAARKSFDSNLNYLNTKTPFLITLRNFADANIPNVVNFAKATTTSPLLDEPSGWSMNTVNLGRALILIDGLDEISEDKQKAFVSWLRSFRNLPAATPIVVTTRHSATEAIDNIIADWGDAAVVADVLPMDRDQIRSFVLHWHTAIAFELQHDARVAFEKESSRVSTVLATAREYRLLASSPLLCAVLCALFHLRRGALPPKRIEIYETLLSLLVVERDAQRGVSVDAIPLSPSERRLVLEDIAEFMLNNQLSECDMSRVLDVVKRSAPLRIHDNTTPELVLQNLVTRSGVLRKLAPSSIDFVHRTFLEYLGALAHVRRDTVELLASKVTSPAWNEAVILASGLGIDRQVQSLVQSVLETTEAALAEQGRGARLSRQAELLSITCAWILDTAVLTHPEQRERLLRAIAWMIPPDNPTAARACAAAGNSLLPELARAMRSNDLTTEQVSASLRTLGEIGSVEALNVIAGIDQEILLAKLSDLVSIWPWFDIWEFAERVLRPLEPVSPTPVRITNTAVLRALSALPENFRWICDVEMPEGSLPDNITGAQLESLSVVNLNLLDRPEAADGSFVWWIGSVERLTLAGFQRFSAAQDSVSAPCLKDLTLYLTSPDTSIDNIVWSYLPVLQNLHLGGSGVADLRGLTAARDLKSLTVEGPVKIVNAHLAGELPTLEMIEWVGVNDTEPLQDLLRMASKLETLVIDGDDEMVSLSIFSMAESVVTFEVYNAPGLTDISALTELPQLCHVTIGGIHAVDPPDEILYSLEHLRTIQISVPDADDYAEFAPSVVSAPEPESSEDDDMPPDGRLTFSDRWEVDPFDDADEAP